MGPAQWDADRDSAFLRRATGLDVQRHGADMGADSDADWELYRQTRCSWHYDPFRGAWHSPDADLDHADAFRDFSALTGAVRPNGGDVGAGRQYFSDAARERCGPRRGVRAALYVSRLDWVPRADHWRPFISIGRHAV